jgi:DNA invertase Pin-like site-specific DNA recombinase
MTSSSPASAPTAAIYTRVSDPSQERGTSPETQQAGALEYCAQRGYTVTPEDTYIEPAHSGADLWERPALQRLLANLHAGKYQHVVVLALDRLSRDTNHQGYLFSECERVGAHLESVTEDLSDDSLQGRILRAVAGVVAEVERQKIAERTMRGTRAKAAQGHLPRGNVPLYGYAWVNEPLRGYVPDDDSTHRCPAAIVRRIYREYGAGVPIYTIAERLTQEGDLTPFDLLASRGQVTQRQQEWAAGVRTGRPVTHAWRRDLITRLLKEPKYAGEALAFRSHDVKRRVQHPDTGEWQKRRRHTLRTPDDPAVVPLPAATVPALVDAETAAAVRSRLARAKDERSRTARHPASRTQGLLARGLVRCGHCGGWMGPQPDRRGGTGGFYGCTRYGHHHPSCAGRGHSINIAKLDAQVWRAARWLLGHPEVLRERAARELAAGAEVQVAQAAARLEVDDRIKRLGQRRAALMRLAELADPADTTTIRETAEKLAALGKEEQQAHAEAERLTRAESQVQDTLTRWDQWERWAKREAVRLATQDHPDPATQRQLLRDLDLCVTVWRTDHRPRLEVVFFHSQMEALAGQPGRLAVARLEAAALRAQAAGLAVPDECPPAWAEADAAHSGDLNLQALSLAAGGATDALVTAPAQVPGGLAPYRALRVSPDPPSLATIG